MRLFAKSPMEMHREAEGKTQCRSPEPGSIDPALRPPLASNDEEKAYLDSCAEWLVHVQSGRIEVK